MYKKLLFAALFFFIGVSPALAFGYPTGTSQSGTSFINTSSSWSLWNATPDSSGNTSVTLTGYSGGNTQIGTGNPGSESYDTSSDPSGTVYMVGYSGYQWYHNYTYADWINSEYGFPACTNSANGMGDYVCVYKWSNGSLNFTPEPSGPAVGSFIASSTTITLGNSSTLSWTVSGATLVTIDNGVGSVATSTGSVLVYPIATTTYTLTAGNGTATTTATSTVNVILPPPLPPQNPFNEIFGSATSSPAVWNIGIVDNPTQDYFEGVLLFFMLAFGIMFG